MKKFNFHNFDKEYTKLAKQRISGFLLFVLLLGVCVNAIAKEISLASIPNSSVVLDFSVQSADSWDAKNKPKNVVANCINGNKITGFEYTNIKLETFNGSFLQEAIIGFSSTNPNDDGIQLIVGFGRNEPGTGIFSSNGIIDITDTGNEDVISANDGQFLMQFYEQVDDASDAIDAKYTAGTLTVWGVDLVATDSCQFISGKGGTDLSVTYSQQQTQSSQEQTMAIGDSLQLNIVVKNHTGFTASSVSLENTLSDKLQFDSLNCSDGTSINSAAGIANVSLQDIGSFAALNCTLNATISQSGEIINTVTVNASNDFNTANNSATLVIAGTPNQAVPIPFVSWYFLLALMVSLLWVASGSFKPLNKS